MNTPIKQRNPNPLTQAQVVAYISGSAVEYTADHDITVSEYGKRIVHGFAATAEHTFTLPTLTSLNDGIIYTIINKSYYKLTVDCESSDDHVWQGRLGVEMPDIWTSITVQGNLAANCYDIIHKAGGRVIVQGVKLHESMNEQPGVNLSSNYQYKVDFSNKHTAEFRSNVQPTKTAGAKFAPNAWQFDGADDYLFYPDSPDWDIFGTQTGVKTVAGWVYHNATGSAENYCNQQEDASNYWTIYKAADDELYVDLKSGGSFTAGLNSAGTVGDTAWLHIALVFNGVDIGLYVNGTQVAYDGTWTADSFTGSLYFGAGGGASAFLAGRMQDWHIAYNDTLGLSGAPDAGLTSTYTVPAAPMNLVM